MNAKPIQLLDDRRESVLVENGNECALDAFLPVQCALQAFGACVQGASLRPKANLNGRSLIALRKGYQQGSGGQRPLKTQANTQLNVDHVGAAGQLFVGHRTVVGDGDGARIHIGDLATEEAFHPCFHIDLPA